MQIKTNVRAGQGGSSSGLDSSTSTSSKNQTGKGGVTDVVATPVYVAPAISPYYARCTGI